jgi:hypothetical protein
MKTHITFLILFISIFFSTTSFAEENRYGIGAAFSTTAKLYFPINTKNYLFEPVFSFYNSSTKPTSGSTAKSRNRNRYDLGVGVFKKSAITNKTIVYYGARVGYNFTKSDSSSTTTTDLTEDSKIYISPTFGAEYFLSLKFSVSLDFSVQYANSSVKDSSTSGGSTTNGDITKSTLDTNTDIIFRYHF